MLSKLRRKPVKYVFSVRVESIEPWPIDAVPVAIHFERGSRKDRKGTTKCVVPQKKQVAKRERGALVFNEVIQFSATLYQEKGGRGPLLGPYMRKILNLRAVEMDVQDNFIYAVLGETEVDLAKYAAPSGFWELELELSCLPEIAKIARGTPVLKLTMECWYKGTCGTGSVSNASSPVSSIAQHFSGSILDTNGSLQLASPHADNGDSVPGRMTGEQLQNLRGFGSGIQVASERDESGVFAVRVPRDQVGESEAKGAGVLGSKRDDSKAGGGKPLANAVVRVTDSADSMKGGTVRQTDKAGGTKGVQTATVPKGKAKPVGEMFFVDDDELEKSRTKYAAEDKKKAVPKTGVAPAEPKTAAAPAEPKTAVSPAEPIRSSPSPRTPVLQSIPEGDDKADVKVATPTPKVFLPRQPWLMQIMSALVCCPAPSKPDDA